MDELLLENADVVNMEESGWKEVVVKKNPGGEQVRLKFCFQKVSSNNIRLSYQANVRSYANRCL